MTYLVRATMRFALVLLLALTAVACDDDEGTPPESPTAQPPAATATAEVETTTVQVYFLNEPNFVAGTEPYVTPVEREVEAPAVAQGALEALFAGPAPEEEADGLRLETSEATGFADLEIADGIARVRLTGGCSSGGSTFTVAQEIVPTLKQFPSVQYVKILDPDGTTEEPEGPTDSIPFCLEP